MESWTYVILGDGLAAVVDLGDVVLNAIDGVNSRSGIEVGSHF